MTTTAQSSNQLVCDARKQEEVDFHNQREVDRKALGAHEFEERYSNKKWYSIVRKSHAYSENWLKTHCPGSVALDYCCGLGGMSLKMAQYGAYVHGIDISDESVRTASELMSANGFSDKSSMCVMDAENLTFPDATFDVIVCSGVLHHLDLKHAYPQLARVLKPNGRILCLEAVGHNPIIRLYRKLTPSLRTSWEVDHILKRQDVRRAAEFFDKVDIQFFHLLSIGTVPLRKTALFNPALTICEAIDSALLRVPGLRWMAWQMAFELSRPKRGVAKRHAKAA